MPTGGKDNLELYEEREKELLEKLERYEIDDPKRKSIINELEVLSRIRNSYEQTEQTRLNNNRQNDIKEEQLVIDAQKVENERKKTKSTWGQAGMYLGGSIFLTGLSYFLDTVVGPVAKKGERFAERLTDMIKR